MSLAKYGKRVVNKLPYIHLTRTTVQAITTGGLTKPIEFNAIVDDDNNESEGLNTSSAGVRVKRGGIYTISGFACYEGTMAVGTRNIAIVVNGLPNIIQLLNHYDENVSITLPISLTTRLEKNDKVTLETFQSTGSDLNIDPTITGCLVFLVVSALSVD